ncbi:sodium- and chloride-dependent creatine transporter 1-like [Haliotis rufescens]|uniref:sodium- and chloride-dependent creatine transporter 1-like n=1 Tax=Haliotis rufescens TaxID=6454 RepID=UPI00201EB890|nr:sodium- and chloride-dependent creatine transporter 1-like [Haliotis rufescens]
MAGERWRHHLDYIITSFGSSIGSGAFIKFPYLCMRNGGGAFVIPFALFTIIAVMPCVFLDMVIGQLSQSGPINAWNMCPPFKGIGVGILILIWIIFTLYNAIFSWFVYFFYQSFSSTLPWAHCNNDWNTPSCISDSGIHVASTNHSEVTNCTAYSHQLVYVTVGVPFVLIIVFLVRGCLLPGSAEGMYYFIKPNFDKLTEPGVIQSLTAVH